MLIDEDFGFGISDSSDWGFWIWDFGLRIKKELRVFLFNQSEIPNPKSEIEGPVTR